MFLISTLSYLWKNTFKRWFESPVSPLARIVLTTVLGLFTVAILVLFRGLEREIETRLAASDINDVFVTELVPGQDAATTLLRSYEEESMWQSRYGKDRISLYWRPLVGATYSGDSVPILAYGASDPVVSAEVSDPESPPAPTLLMRDPGSQLGQRLPIEIADRRIFAKVQQCPQWLSDKIGNTIIVVMPLALAAEPLSAGYILYSYAALDSFDEVRSFLAETRAYYGAEDRRVQITSAEGVMDDLEKFIAAQRHLGSGLTIGCAVILALVLGAIAWLEYRNDAYILALLRSFGIASPYLLIHSIAENVLLISAGVLLVLPLWEWISPRVLATAGDEARALFANSGVELIDLQAITAAGLVGCAFAALPIAWSLRRRPGHLLK